MERGTGRDRQRRTRRRGCLAFFLALVMVFVSGCDGLPGSREPLPEDTIEAFEYAVNHSDADAMLDCLSEDTVKAVTAGMNLAMGILGSVTGVDLKISAEDILDMLPLMQVFAQPYMEGQESAQVDFQVTETRIKGKKATVYFVEKNSGEPAAINMELEDEGWKMTMDLNELTRDEAEKVLVDGRDLKKEQENPRSARGDGSEEGSLLGLLLDKERLKEFLTDILTE